MRHTLFCRRVFWSLTPPRSLQQRSLSAMSRTVKKAVEAARQRKETEINVSDEGISNIEDVPELFAFRSLTRLILSHNKISDLPFEIANLTSLECLNLFNNHLEDLPSTISGLPKLRELNVALNRICELPRGFGSFPALEILDLTYNNLTSSSFSANFSYLGVCLRALYLGDNDLTAFPPCIDQFVHLEILVLRDNDIVEFPPTIDACGKLKTLHLQGNQINVVPPDFGQMNFLGEKSSFKISDNPLIQCLDARSVNVKQFFDYLKTDEYRSYYRQFSDSGRKPTRIKRDYRSAKKCRAVKRHKLFQAQH